MYGIYANIGGILMVNVTYIAYMDPMGYDLWLTNLKKQVLNSLKHNMLKKLARA